MLYGLYPNSLKLQKPLRLAATKSFQNQLALPKTCNSRVYLDLWYLGARYHGCFAMLRLLLRGCLLLWLGCLFSSRNLCRFRHGSKFCAASTISTFPTCKSMPGAAFGSVLGAATRSVGVVAHAVYHASKDATLLLRLRLWVVDVHILEFVLLLRLWNLQWPVERVGHARWWEKGPAVK